MSTLIKDKTGVEMIFGKTSKDKRSSYISRRDKLAQPRPWFAWRPVQLYLDGRWIWLSRVTRTVVVEGFFTTYEEIAE